MILKLKEIIGEYCSQRQSGATSKGGEFVRQLIIENWSKGEKIEISFEGVKLVTPSFADEAFGKLVLTYSLEQLKNKLIFLGIDGETKDKINKGIELRLQKKEGEVMYKGYKIESLPYQLADSKEWAINIYIWLDKDGNLISRNFTAKNTYSSREEAIKNCIIFGRKIIDGEYDNLSVKGM